MKAPTAVLGVALAGFLLLPARPAAAGEESRRTVTVRLAVDRTVSDMTAWRFRANAFLNYSVRTFRSRFGIDLAIKSPCRWAPALGKKTIEEALSDLATKVPPNGGDIVVGIINPDHVSSQTLGIASYTNSCILLSDELNEDAMRYAFLHELCHIFGAIDLKEKGSVMSVTGPAMDIDPFTEEAVRLNRERIFTRGRFPLSGDQLDPAIALYKKRAGLGLGEAENYLFLTLLYLEKDDLDAATQTCTEAIVEEPAILGIQILLGNLRLSRGQPELAAAHYEKALERQPSNPSLHYNLGLARAELHDYTKATEEFRAALKINEGFLPARLALARLLLAAGSAEAAAAECRRALESDPRSVDALTLLGTAMVALAAPFTSDPEARSEPSLAQPNTIAPGSPEAQRAVEDAIPILERSIALDPQDTGARVSLGTAFAAQRRYDEAEAAFLEALKLEPGDVDAHFGLGRLYLDRGEMNKAVFHLQQILSIDASSDVGSRVIARAFSGARPYPLLRHRAGR
ncbi:MAG TPA: tetratricopeptide repeat protein [Candidatus Bathyarchaeia archaeon]|nr:tetratricopeptide repeat protein [Candidatus Bathyarchaeia archaeon]